jgi:uncharacterized membrane protein (DUF485 family)
MDPKGKGMVVNDKEKESFLNESRDDKPTDSGSSHKKKDEKNKRRIKKIVYYDSDESTTRKRNRLAQIFHLIILVFRIIPMPICFLFLSVNLHTLMERTMLFGVTKCVVTFFLSILVFGR